MNGNRTELDVPLTVIDKTDSVVRAGVLPHSTDERDHAYAVLDPRYTGSGGKGYIEDIANMQAASHVAALTPEIWLGNGLGLKSERRKAEEAQLRAKVRNQTQEALVDDMVDYTEDAKLTIDSLYALDKALEGVDSAEEFDIPDDLDLYPELQRAIAALVRLYETKQYIAEGKPRKTPMNADLLDDRKLSIQKRIAAAMRDLTVGEARRDLTEALRLEIGRLELWLDQLFGHPGKSAEKVELGEEGSFDEPTVRRRYGAVAVNSDIAARINSRVNTFDTYRE